MSEAIVELKGAVKEYVNGSLRVTAMRGIDLRIDRGEYAVIMGSSGSGKSTCLNILGCLDRLTQGTYLLGGDDVSDLTDDELSEIRSKRLGFIFQSYNLIPQLNVLENIEVPLFYQGVPESEARVTAEKLAARMGLSARLKHKPMELSGGQQQRVAIARSLVCDPILMLADEPTGNLDSKTGHEILELIDELHAEGKTIVMVTHDDEIAHRAQRVVWFKDGDIISNEWKGAPKS
jgi:putative ABC transport system ATP-binding protein